MKFTDILTQTLINEGTAWKSKKDAQSYCDTMKNVYGLKCKPVQVDKKWDYWNVEYPNQNKITESDDSDNDITKKTPAEQVAKTATDTLIVSLDKAVSNAIDDISKDIIGPKVKEFVADDLRDSLENFNKDIEDSEEFIQSIVEQLEETLKANLSESFKIEVKENALKNLSDLVNKEILKVQFKDEDKQFAT